MVARLQDAEIDRVFRALADVTRRDILRRTLAGELSVSGLASDYAAVQKHVAVLEKAGLVRKTTAGRERLVRADPERIACARACLQKLEALWRHRIDALDVVLSEPEE